MNTSHTVPAPDLFSTRLDGPAPEIEVSRDMIKRGLIVGPVLIAVCAVIWGSDGAWSSAYGIAIVLVNFALAAGIIAGAARISLGLMMARHAVRLPDPPRPDLPRRLDRARRRLDFVSGTRIDHHRHAPWSPVLGDEVRRTVAGATRPQDNRAMNTTAP